MKRTTLSFGGIVITSAAILTITGCSGSDGTTGPVQASGGTTTAISFGGTRATFGGTSSITLPKGGTTALGGATGTMVAGSSATGGATATSATSAVIGGASSVGGTSAATGGASAVAVGGSTAATGGTSAVAAGGSTSAIGGASAATGGTSAVATGGTTSDVGGASAATGGTSAVATGGASSSTGGSTVVATGGTTAATGGTTSNTGGTSAATGGTTGTGGTTAVAPCGVFADPFTPFSYCRPTYNPVTGLTGNFTAGAVSLTGTGTALAITSSTAVASAGPFVPAMSPYTTPTTCAGMGVDARNSAGDQFTGMELSATNAGTTDVTLTLYLDDKTTNGQALERVYLLGTVPAGTTNQKYTLTWNNSYTDSCTLATGDSFNQQTISRLNFSVASVGGPSNLNVTISNITFVPVAVVATSPCSGICTGATALGATSNTSFTAAAMCLETTTATFSGGNCGGLATGRTFSINGVTETCNWANFVTIPAKVNGGYCLYSPAATAGGAFNLW